MINIRSEIILFEPELGNASVGKREIFRGSGNPGAFFMHATFAFIAVLLAQYLLYNIQKFLNRGGLITCKPEIKLFEPDLDNPSVGIKKHSEAPETPEPFLEQILCIH